MSDAVCQVHTYSLSRRFSRSTRSGTLNNLGHFLCQHVRHFFTDYRHMPIVVTKSFVTAWLAALTGRALDRFESSLICPVQRPSARMIHGPSNVNASRQMPHLQKLVVVCKNASRAKTAFKPVQTEEIFAHRRSGLSNNASFVEPPRVRCTPAASWKRSRCLESLRECVWCHEQANVGADAVAPWRYFFRLIGPE
jgi:hypothetical protein